MVDLDGFLFLKSCSWSEIGALKADQHEKPLSICNLTRRSQNIYFKIRLFKCLFLEFVASLKSDELKQVNFQKLLVPIKGI